MMCPMTVVPLADRTFSRVLFWKIRTCHKQFMLFLGQIPKKNMIETLKKNVSQIKAQLSGRKSPPPSPNRTATFQTRYVKHVRCFTPPRSSNSPLLSNKISGTSSAPASLGGLGWNGRRWDFEGP